MVAAIFDVIHAGKTLERLRTQKFPSPGKLAGEVGMSDQAIYDAEGKALCPMRESNLRKVLKALGESEAEFLRRVGVGWDGTFEAELRLEVATAMERLDRDQLHELAALARDLMAEKTERPGSFQRKAARKSRAPQGEDNGSSR